MTWPTTIRGPRGDAESRLAKGIINASPPLHPLDLGLVYLEPHDSRKNSHTSISLWLSFSTSTFSKIFLLIHTLLYNNLAHDSRRISLLSLLATFTSFPYDSIYIPDNFDNLIILWDILIAFLALIAKAQSESMAVSIHSTHCPSKSHFFFYGFWFPRCEFSGITCRYTKFGRKGWRCI